MSSVASHIAEAISEYLVRSDRSRLLDVISTCDTVELANQELQRLTGVRSFFSDSIAFNEFARILALPESDENSRTSREWGDFQTPPGLALRVCSHLANTGISPQVIIEPTCGCGNFILAALRSFPKAERVYAVEIQDKYEWQLKIALLTESLLGHHSSAEIEFHKDDIFTHRFPDGMLRARNILIVGNPPWVTNSELTTLRASNIPAKRNVKGLNGLDAITGKSNFDLGEFILLRILELFSEQSGTLAMLCKNSVVRNIVEALPRRLFKVSDIRAYEIDASREFGASVNASLLVMKMGTPNTGFSCQISRLENPSEVTRTFGWTGNRFVSDVDGYRTVSQLDGKSPIVWRQGLKHDCARIMELEAHDGTLVNGNGEVVDIEPEWVHWFLKGSDLRTFQVNRARKKVIVTQLRMADDTSHLQTRAPKLWDYLVRNSDFLEKRKSSIYQARPRFSIFGVGEYSFKPYKVGICGLYKEPRFSLVLPIDNRPVMLDDTCYFLAFDTYSDAFFAASVLNAPVSQQFLRSIAFTDAKRPYTKEVLMRVDLGRLIHQLSFDDVLRFWPDIGCEAEEPVTESDFEHCKRRFPVTHEREEGLQLTLGMW
ncbi:MAG: SAM-dependent methyltransferase [Chloroflexi bacterium]|nr:SAM-dependent methyltransferase [Chloroflexota bacterium]